MSAACNRACLCPVELPALHVLRQHVMPVQQHLVRIHTLEQAPYLNNVLIPARIGGRGGGSARVQARAGIAEAGAGAALAAAPVGTAAHPVSTTGRTTRIFSTSSSLRASASGV